MSTRLICEIERRKFSNLPPAKKQKKDSDLEIDSFSQLPDHIIASVLSWLPLKDAVRTSVVARRWEKLWSFRLGSDILLRHDQYTTSYTKARDFVAWVNRILKSRREQQVSEFAIRYALNGQFSAALKSWLAFALKKNVKRLDLDLVHLLPQPRRFTCVFPDFTNLSPEYTSLEKVCLSGVKADPIAFQHFLSKCPSLEHLCLRRLRFRDGRSFATLNVESQTLKCLETAIRKPPSSIRTFHCRESYRGFSDAICDNFRFATQLTSLKLVLSMEMVKKSVSSCPQELVAFTALKYLEITMYEDNHHCLLWPICLINAAPALHTFKVEMIKCLDTEWIYDEEGKIIPFEEHKCNGGNISRVEIREHKCLKVVECGGFSDVDNQWELVEQIVKICGSLEKIVLHVRALSKGEDDEWRDANVINAKETATVLLAAATGVKLEVTVSVKPLPDHAILYNNFVELYFSFCAYF